MPETNIPATGEFGAAPPDAARETTEPLQVDAGAIVVHDPRTKQPTGEVIDPIARAQANERELKPLTYENPAAPPSQSVVSGKTVNGLDPFYAEEAKRKAALAAAEPERTMPAMSNTDSPSRGLPGTAPVPAARKTKPIGVTGGFGDAGEAQYFPLTGPELMELTRALLDKLNDRITNDLRFSLAITYPRIAVKLQLIVEGEVDDQGFDVTYVDTKDQTPLDVAKQHGQSVVFVLTEERREFTVDGEVDSPPDAIRKELGMVRPHKQLVQTGSGRVFADLPVGF